MISHDQADIRVRAGNLAAVFYDRAIIKQLAIQLVAGQVEAHLDMISDGGHQCYPTYKEVATCIKSAKETTTDYIEDLLAEFRVILDEEVAKTSIRVDSVKFVASDDIDADVHVS
jgi:hypothetical protein